MIIFLIENFLPLLNHSVENTFLQKTRIYIKIK